MPLALVLAFAVLLLLVLLALLWSHWPRWLKAMLVTGVTVLYFWGFQVVGALLGLPSPGPLPERFVMVSALVQEPAGNTQGAIFLWVRPLAGGVAAPEPRAFRTAYSRPLHEQINEGVRKGREGVAQMGTAQAKDGRGRGGGWLQPGQDEQEVRIRDLPQPQLPEK
jgi:hypothetical protein